ncbi:MAG: ABC transporter ATP-binding protein [Acidimicrobiia bacterium]|nr:ABC transporter ATP-binding protein [Acidimicrobiia bacterium]
MDAAPEADLREPRPDWLLEVADLAKHFPIGGGLLGGLAGSVRAVDGVSFQIARGETLALVGESGCGKSTTGRLVMRLLEPTAGSVRYDGQDIASLPKSRMKDYRKQLQIIFQDPYSSLDPRMSVGRIVGEGLAIHHIGQRGADRRARVEQLLEQVGLSADDVDRFPHQFSGGQRQRISIARALATDPELIVCDEPVSALDVSVQAQIINLLKDLQRERGLSYLFVSHDLNVVRYIADRVCVMYLGEIVESAPTEELFADPVHPYTKGLLDAIPQFDAVRKVSERAGLRGEIADPSNMPTGCRFHPRCPHATPECSVVEPQLTEISPSHSVAACPCFSSTLVAEPTA